MLVLRSEEKSLMKGADFTVHCMRPTQGLFYVDILLLYVSNVPLCLRHIDYSVFPALVLYNKLRNPLKPALS